MTVKILPFIMDPEDDSVAACNKYNPDVVSQSLLA